MNTTFNSYSCDVWINESCFVILFSLSNKMTGIFIGSSHTFRPTYHAYLCILFELLDQLIGLPRGGALMLTMLAQLTL
jgi:hypothetical protein